MLPCINSKTLKSFIIGSLFSFIVISCQSVKPPKNISDTIDYTNDDVVAAEIERINSMMENEPVRALWRSLLLKNDEVTEKSLTQLTVLFERAIEEKDYAVARKYYISLKNAGWKSDKYTDAEIAKIYKDDIPGLSGKNDRAPKSIADCMEGTCTIWVDRGLKVKNGAGYSDIVLGSGFFIDERGYLITNHHVIESVVDPKYEGYVRLYIKLLEDSDTKIPAKVIGYDPIMDFALLKVEITPKVVFNLGSSSDLKIGDKISAIGTPIGLEGTLTSGIVSSTDRKLVTLGNVFQIDAAVNSGNSGGPLIDEKMQVQAVVFAGMLQFQGLNFAIPIEYLKQELYSLYSNDMVIHPWIGAYGHTKRKGNKKVGLEVQYVMPGGSAFISGIKEGDVITEIEGQKITSIDDLQFIMMAYENETLLNCKLVNEDEEEKELLVYLEQRPEAPAVTIYNSDFQNGSFIPLFGLGLTNSSTLNKNSYTIKNVIKGSVADEMKFSINDPVTVKDIKFDKENEYIFAQIVAKRRKNGFLDISIVLSSPYDGPYYF